MNMQRRYNEWFVYLILLLLIQVGCTSAPVQEMSDARQSLQAAKTLSTGLVKHNKFTNTGQQLTDQNLKVAELLLQQAQDALEMGDYKLAKLNAKKAREIAFAVQQELQVVSSLSAE